jgi:Flp pilus assembly protein TadG
VNTIEMKTERKAHRRESGSAIVETALVAIFVLIPLLLGAIDFGRAFYISIEVANAARTAVQYASQSEQQLQDTTNVVNVAMTEAPDVQTTCGAGKNACWVSGYPTASWGCECSNQSTPTGGTPNSTSCTCTGHMVLYSLVSTQVTYTPMFNLFHLFPAITMNSQAKTRYALN